MGRCNFSQKNLLLFHLRHARLYSAMQFKFPAQFSLRDFPRNGRALTLRRAPLNPAPYLYAIPASLDGKMQLPPGHFPLHSTPLSRDTRTQTSTDKATASLSKCARKSNSQSTIAKSKRKCPVQGYFIPQDDSGLVSCFEVYEPQRLTTACPVGFAFANRVPFYSVGFSTACCIMVGMTNKVEHDSFVRKIYAKKRIQK